MYVASCGLDCHLFLLAERLHRCGQMCQGYELNFLFWRPEDAALGEQGIDIVGQKAHGCD